MSFGLSRSNLFRLSCTGALPLLLSTSSAYAEPQSPAPCLSPIAKGGQDPVVRDIHFNFPNSTYIGATLCVVSDNQFGFWSIGATVTVFKEDGSLFTSGGAREDKVGPVVIPDPKDQPKVVWVMPAGIPIDPKYAGHVQPQALAVVQWIPCQAALPTCNPGAQQTTTYLLPVTFDQPTRLVRRK